MKIKLFDKTTLDNMRIQGRLIDYGNNVGYHDAYEMLCHIITIDNEHKYYNLKVKLPCGIITWVCSKQGEIIPTEKEEAYEILCGIDWLSAYKYESGKGTKEG